MKDEIQERYVFWRFAIQDFFESAKTLDLLDKTDDDEIRSALIRCAVVAYARPFSGNKAKFREMKWRIEPSWVPDNGFHTAVIELRDKLLAHSDIEFREPNLAKIGSQYPISMKTTAYHTLLDIVEPLKQLSKSMIGVMREKCWEYEEQHFGSR